MKKLYKSIVALAALWLTGAATAQAGDVTTLYNWVTDAAEAINGASQWDETELGEWSSNKVLDATLGIGVKVNKKGTQSTSRTITGIETNSILTYNISWFVRSKNYGGNYCVLTLGNFISFKCESKKLKVTLNGVEGSGISLGSSDPIVDTLKIRCIVNTSNQRITALTVTKSDNTELLSLSAYLTGEETEYSLSGTPTYSSITMSGTATGSRDEFSLLKRISILQETQSVSTYDYTVNYKLGENIVKTVGGSLAEGAPIPVLTALDGEGTYEGNHYLIAADVAPVKAVTTDAAANVLNVDVRAPYSTTLNVFYVVDGVKDAEATQTLNFTETDTKEANWTYYFPYYITRDSKWYKATLKDGTNFGETGTFNTTGGSIEKEVVYTLDEQTAYFGESQWTGDKGLAYSNGERSSNTGKQDYTYNNIALAAGTYEMIVPGTSYGACTIKMGGDSIGTIKLGGGSFVFVKSDDENVTFNFSGNMRQLDYFLIKKNPSVTVTIGSTGFATFSNAQYALDFTNVEGLKAYTVTVDGEQLQTAEVTAAVPASTGLLLKGAAGTYNVPAVATAEALASNDLLPTTGSALSEAGYVFYGLTENDGKVCFGLIGDFAPSAGKAYLKVADTGEARAFYHFAETDVTGINEIGNRQSSNRQMYDLQGRRLMKATRGLYVIDGKKYIVK